MRPVDSLSATKYQPGPRPAPPPEAADKDFRPKAGAAANATDGGAPAGRPLGLADLGRAAPPASLARSSAVAAAPSSPAGAGGAAPSRAEPALQRAAREFEGILMRYLASAMWETLPGSDAGGMAGAHFYQGMIEEQLGRLLVEGGHGPGLAGALVRQVSADPEEEA